MRYLLIIFILVFSINGYSLNAVNEMENSLVVKHFTKAERLELSKIVSYVDGQVLLKNKYTDLNKAYHYYLDSVYQLAKSGKPKSISFDEQRKYEFLFSIDATLFNKIWKKSTSAKMVRTKDTTLYQPQNYITIDLNYKGQYMELLKELGNKNKYYQNLAENTLISGGFSPVIFSEFLISNKNFDFNTIEDRLWASIFLLTLEESVDMKVKRFVNKSKLISTN